jgi:hypothetical protein
VLGLSSIQQIHISKTKQIYLLQYIYILLLFRRKYYMLYEQTAQKRWSSPFDVNDDPVHHIFIHSANAMKNFVGDFPSATELTLSKSFYVYRNSILNSLSSIIPLRQLTKITLDCHRFSFMQVAELLNLAPNVHTLKLESILLYGTDFVSFKNNQIFQNVSNTNTVTNVTIDTKSTLDKIQLLSALFPRVEYLTINLHTKDLESIVRFLLSKSNNNTRHLSLLCLSKQFKDLMKKLNILIESEELLDGYTIKVFKRNIYLWW